MTAQLEVARQNLEARRGAVLDFTSHSGSANGQSANAPLLRRYSCLSDEQIEQLPKVQFVIPDLIPVNALVEIHGAPGSGKSFLVLDWLLCIATGRPWCFRSVKRGAVVSVITEGSAGYGQRLRAWKHARAYSGAAGVYFVTSPVNLCDSGDVARFIADVREQVPGEIAVVSFDTLAQSMLGADENSSRDMGQALSGAHRIRTELACSVLLIHHTGKSGETERGSTALRGAVDVMLGLKKEDDDRIALSCEKAKDFAAFDRIYLKLEPLLDSCVISAKTDWQTSSQELTLNERQILESLTRDFEDDGAYSGKLQIASAVAERTFQRSLTALVRKGYVASTKEGRSKRYTVSVSGRDAIYDTRQTSAKYPPGGDHQRMPATTSPLREGGAAMMAGKDGLDRGEAWEPES